ncbi:uncharacterized protein LOC115631050 [Scaptodrosophila lebanonensis]|uniref:Uncharacterized protein LOC115631050 n=1 Tax=Drosophila lebanonensis TaxID=7225 RepID=A0A6J2U4M5_DROLE|nr:uncharacterized protein LOC115631050 [Scaptodrosophila lebanonensis]XP_030383556.1 uncharacterized protein LOC115631050 [Scaptodrosophila lebanonensis]
MDIESDSDTSERWEDFFGSSTELAPSLLGIYDTLTNSLAAHQLKSNGNGNDHSDGDANDEETPKRNSSSSCHSSQSDEPQKGSYTLEQRAADAFAASLQVAGLREERDGAQLSRLVKPQVSGTPRASSLSSHSSSLSLTSNSSTGSRRGNHIIALSPNVQRIITHADAPHVDAIDIEALQQKQLLNSPSQSPVPHCRYIKKSPTPAATSTPKQPKLSHIPLSKITGKLSTQSGSELVQTFDSSTEYLNSLCFAEKSFAEKKARKCKLSAPPTPAAVHIPTLADDDKTPTNPSCPFTFDTALGQKTRKLTLPRYETQQSIKLIEMEQLAATSTQLLHGKPATPTPTTTTATTTANNNSNSSCTKTSNNNANDNNNSGSSGVNTTRPKEFVVATEPLSPVELMDTINFDLVTQHIEQLTLCDQLEAEALNETGTQLIEAINKPLISKPLVRSCSAACASTISTSPLLTYARTKSLNAKANTLGGAVPLKLPTAEQLAELEEANKLSAESLDRLTDIKPKFLHKDGRRLGANGALMLPEIARLNNRPLSSSSICSTSSSSSSGSDQLNGKLATSYLASVESLAESENELGDPHSGLTIFERACLEIVDSERSYVEDLGQVIKGYLHDWKERACLRIDELQILFANIEEIYEFNATLLKQLMNSGMDPNKIAKCFINLRERFDVYTTYCTSYPEAISLLTKLLQATHTNALLASTQKMLEHRLPLGSYLLKPVQRILKYHLLLDSLRKHCDVKEVSEAYSIMRQVAHNIDQVKRNQEQQSRVKELSGILDGWLGPELTVLGELRQEGLLMEHNKPRLVLLFATMLIITKQKEDGRLQFKNFIYQKNLMLSEHLPGEPTSFYVIPFDEPRNQIKLTARNRDQKRVWTQHIKSVMLEQLDIPMRAKELVFQLGNEEDRTPDRSTWKWSLHSNSSTPTYLERRNACRRSEIRNRNSKFKRKTVTNSSSFDSFNESLEQEAVKPAKPLTRNNSLDDTALQKLAAAVRYRSGKRESRDATAITTVENGEKANGKAAAGDASPSKDCKCSEDEHCLCILRDQRASRTKSPIFSYKALKERSKSVPRISQSVEEDLDEDSASLRGSKPNLSERKVKGKGLLEVKQYNHKTMPKRIANLKKQRCSKKETCKFYMDLSEFESSSATVLKITESTEDVRGSRKLEVELAEEAQETTAVDAEQEQQSTPIYETLSPAEKSKRDAQVILDLLKNNKEFERIYNKQQKRRESNSTSTTPLSPLSPTQELRLPPRPPSRSPPPLELEQQEQSDQPCDQEPVSEEPIYETLLRNVHVPYKFSPVLGRAKSGQYFKARQKKSTAPAARPDSDYVTLVYSPEGVLQRVGEDVVTRQHSSYELQRDSTDSNSSSGSTVKRDSQNTVINLSLDSSSQSNLSQGENTVQSEAPHPRPIQKNIMKRLLSSSSYSSKTSLENVSSSELSLLPRALKSIDNLSMAFGRSNRPPERRVSDVSEMCRQSILHRQGSEAVGERMAHVDYADPKTLFSIVASSEASLQRDSVFSLTSSSDSMCEQQRKRSAAELPTNFEYEQDVEDNLEKDFRDSAIYSDDNEKRSGDYNMKRPQSPPPPPPPSRNSQQPPQIAPKPTKATLHDLSSVIVCPSHMSPAASRSWVLQQIENFSK